ncbi:MAG: hypothetical protein ACR2O0_06160 [Rhizobiaceae bacterium]
MNTAVVAALSSALVIMAAGATFSTHAQGSDIQVTNQPLTPAECERQSWPAIDASCLVTISGEHSNNVVRVAAQY